MKKVLVYLIFILIICFLSVGFADNSEMIDNLVENGRKEAFEGEGFSLYFPNSLVSSKKDLPEDISSDFYTANSIYEFRGDYEFIRVSIGTSKEKNKLFTENFGFAKRDDIDLSLLTEKQLLSESEELTAYIDQSFPLYMNYNAVTSMLVDDRLGLVVTGYYTDYENSITGEFRAYEFYYMGKTILIYYDTQIEGTYFSDVVFRLPDSIISTIDFELNPTDTPKNSAAITQAVDMLLPSVMALFSALILGFVIGNLGKIKKQEKQVPEEAERIAEVAMERSAKIIEEPVLDEISIDEADSLTSFSDEEAVDWNNMINEIKEKELSNSSQTEEDTAQNTDKLNENKSKQHDIDADKANKEARLEKKNANISDELLSQINTIGDNLNEEVENLKDLNDIDSKKEDDKIKQSSEEISEELSYEDYLSNILPNRDMDAKQEIPEETNDDLNKPDTKIKSEPKQEVKAQMDKIDVVNERKESNKSSSEKKKGFLSSMLSSIVNKIETDDADSDSLDEFDSRGEMHRSEKVEQNSIERLIPGLFDDDPDEEELEILIDEAEDKKFEASKNNLALDDESEKELKNEEKDSNLKVRISRLFKKKEDTKDIDK
jgi:hypothetical protein